jgi:RNA ligase (TIGR02306 family)
MFKFLATSRWYKESAAAEADHEISAGPQPEVQTQDGSTYKVPYTTILNITPHNNADRLEVCWVYGFQVIAQKGKFKVGDKVIYVPIDSILPQWLEDRLFPADSKIKLINHRVRQIRIRSLASQGMLIHLEDVQSDLEKMSGSLQMEKDYSHWLEITKYEPPQPGFANTRGKDKQRNKKTEHPLFHKYNGLDNIKWFPTLFKEGEEVVIQEKLHGTNARASVLPFAANTSWKKIKKLFGFAPKLENCYGSNNVDISSKSSYSGFYGEDVYGATFSKMDIFSKLKSGEIVYGEIIGPGIQKGYGYDLLSHEFLVFDVKVLQPDGKFKWMNPDQVVEFCKERALNYVPVVYRGPYNESLAYSLTRGPSVYDPKTKVREGIVIKAATDYDNFGNKKALKWVSEDYLQDESNTDFH